MIVDRILQQNMPGAVEQTGAPMENITDLKDFEIVVKANTDVRVSVFAIENVYTVVRESQFVANNILTTIFASPYRIGFDSYAPDTFYPQAYNLIIPKYDTYPTGPSYDFLGIDTIDDTNRPNLTITGGRAFNSSDIGKTLYLARRLNAVGNQTEFHIHNAIGYIVYLEALNGELDDTQVDIQAKTILPVRGA